jgi:2-polyprenyl-6-methoxyphenol hydroxylase-like FAD-dependent oxidoreductase
VARIIVIGGSLGGLLAANMLSRAGHDVTVLERTVGTLDGRGAGIVTHPPLIAAYLRCGIDVEGKAENALGVKVERRVVLNTDGSDHAEAHIPQTLTSWSRLHALLDKAFESSRYVQGASVQSITQTESEVTVHCADGRAFQAELVVASDGIRSAVRGQYLPSAQPEYAGYVAWRGVCDEAVLSRRTLDTVFDTFGFGLPDGEQLIGYPVAGAGNNTARGHRRYNFVWYRLTTDTNDNRRPSLQSLMTDADGQHYPLGIPPHKVNPAHIAKMRQDAQHLLAPQFVEILEKTAQPFLQPIYDVTSSQLAFGRVALMGDAAFVARPHVGMGVTKAAQDADALTNAIELHGATPAALSAYEALRLSAGLAIIERARALGAHMQSPTRSRRGVMLETAIDVEKVL